MAPGSVAQRVVILSNSNAVYGDSEARIVSGFQDDLHTPSSSSVWDMLEQGSFKLIVEVDSGRYSHVGSFTVINKTFNGWGELCPSVRCYLHDAW